VTAPRRNLEVKARCADLAAARQAIAALGARLDAVQHQTDTYFHVLHGRLKLRECAGQPALLIAYERPDDAGVRASRYFLVPAPDPALLKAGLSATLGVRVVVSKRREVHLWHNVRIHLDEVAALGTFVEFEAVLAAAADEEQSRQYLAELTRALALQPAEMLAQSYADLLAELPGAED